MNVFPLFSIFYKFICYKKYIFNFILFCSYFYIHIFKITYVIKIINHNYKYLIYNKFNMVKIKKKYYYFLE